MPVNANKPDRWKADVAASVDLYNDWFLRFAPKTYRDTRVTTTKQVDEALKATDNLANIRPEHLRAAPTVLPILRMATAPPIARDRLIGLARVSPNLIRSMELEGQVPPRMNEAELDSSLRSVGKVILRLVDTGIFTWLKDGKRPTEGERLRAASIVADRLCGAAADPIIRNAQERRQLAFIRKWLESRGYSYVKSGGLKADGMPPGTFAFRLNVPVKLGGGTTVNLPVDAAILPKAGRRGQLPLLVEAKSAGDFTNTNKRRKEEAAKAAQLRATYGKEVRYILFLCGYFDTGYLGYEAAEGLDWVWEHRIADFQEFGL